VGVLKGLGGEKKNPIADRTVSTDVERGALHQPAKHDS